MGIFTNMLDKIIEIEAEGFDPVKETYGERMKGFDPVIGSVEATSSMSADKVIKLKRRLRQFGRERTGAIRGFYNKEGEEYKLKKDVVEKSKKGAVNVPESSFENIKETDGGFTIGNRPVSSGLPESYYQKGAYAYDALTNTINRGIDMQSSFGQDLIKQGRANLKQTIMNELPESTLKEIGITRQQALEIIPQD